VERQASLEEIIIIEKQAVHRADTPRIPTKTVTLPLVLPTGQDNCHVNRIMTFLSTNILIC